MIDTIASPASTERFDAQLRDELARADAMAETVVPILRHLLVNDNNSLFSDAIVARVRGMVRNLARQLLDELERADGGSEQNAQVEALSEALERSIFDNAAFLSHLHAVALEWHLTEQLQARLAVDPVLSPLLQALIASPEAEKAELGMRFLASQARFCQTQRRMTLSLVELPGDHLHTALVTLRTIAGTEQSINDAAARAEANIRAAYDEAASRLGLISRLVTSLGSGAIAALSMTHAGPAMFLSALAMGSGQDRDQAVIATNEAQLSRLVLSLRSAGLKPDAALEQVALLHPEIGPAEQYVAIDAGLAANLLASAGGFQRG